MKQVRDIVKLHSDMGLSIRKIQGATWSKLKVQLQIILSDLKS